MPSVQASPVSAAITVDGNALGYVGVASVAGFMIGAIAHIANTFRQATVIITDIDTVGNLIGLRIVQDIPQNSDLLGYGRSNLSFWESGSRLSQGVQVVKINPAFAQVGYGYNGN